MSLTSAMLVGYTGINSNSVAVDKVGDNLANVNTTAFKNQRTLFETLLYRTITEGEPPNEQTGGTLPRQIGLGSTVGSMQRDFRQGNLETTAFQSDLAIEGGGFFILERSDGAQVYTRDGSFRLDATQTLVSAGGMPLQVFPADPAGNIDSTSLSNLVIPLGTESQAIATSEVVMDGRLDPRTNMATQGAVVVSDPLLTAAGVPATTATPLTDLVGATGLPLFATGDAVLVRATKGGIATQEATFVVDSTGRTVGDFAAFLESVLGIQGTSVGAGPSGVLVGDGSEFPAGSLVIRSDVGEVNALALDAGSVTNTTGVVTSPFVFQTAAPAVGGGVTTSFNAFDSLGNPVDVRIRMVVESKSATGITWRFFAESVDDSRLSPALGTGTVSFDADGRFVSATGTGLSIDRTGVGSASPLAFVLDFGATTGLAGAEGTSELTMASQDGAPAGVMVNYSIDDEGVVTAVYSNQLKEVLGQVALATFPNDEGLVALSENTFITGPNSGSASVVAPRQGTAGAVRSGALEQSNVEIAREFITLITAATGISSASRVIRVADELLQELLMIAR